MHEPYLKGSVICMVCKQPAVDGRSIAAVTNKVPYLLQLEAPVSATVDGVALWQ